MPYKLNVSDLHVFQQKLAGIWSNAGIPPKADGRPYSFNVMPLPQERPEEGLDIRHDGYILKNFAYTEVITFHGNPAHGNPDTTPNSAPPGGAPNRGFKFRQVPQALFYDQVVRFAEGPKTGDIVHLENGAWLQLQEQPVSYGPYSGKDPNKPTKPDFAKQISVPHGNSILAYGLYTGPHDGKPIIPIVSVLPSLYHPRGTPYSPDRLEHQLGDINDPKKGHYENPDPALAIDPTRPLREFVLNYDIEKFHEVQLHTEMDTSGKKGFVTNIEFEEKMAAAREYNAGYWVMQLKGSDKFEYLAYYQHIVLDLVIQGLHVRFPHVTSNVVKYQGPA